MYILLDEREARGILHATGDYLHDKCGINVKKVVPLRPLSSAFH